MSSQGGRQSTPGISGPQMGVDHISLATPPREPEGGANSGMPALSFGATDR